jgi:uncharacterized protein
MSKRDEYPPGVPCWIDTLQPDPDAAMNFYGGIFEWVFEGPGPMPGEGRYYVARLGGRDAAGIGSQPKEHAARMHSWNTYVSVESADDTAKKARRAGGTVIAEAFDALPAGRMAVLADPTGAAFSVWEPEERRGSQVINEPSAWAMSTLNTAESERAASFYAETFGWTTETFGEGEGAFTLFRLPGYVGGEPRQPVSREVVAAMAPANGDVPAHWSVDFWVHDVDSTASRATQLGGDIVVPPFATPGGKTTVLADPHGISFSVSNVPG